MELMEGLPFHRWLQGAVTFRVNFEMVERVSHGEAGGVVLASGLLSNSRADPVWLRQLRLQEWALGSL